MAASGLERDGAAQIDGGGRRVNGAAEAAFHQVRQIAAVIDMRMREDDGVDRAGIEGQIAVAVLGCLQTAMTDDQIPAQDQNIVVGALLIASVILPNAGDLYRRVRARLRSAGARRHAAAAIQGEGP